MEANTCTFPLPTFLFGSDSFLILTPDLINKSTLLCIKSGQFLKLNKVFLSWPSSCVRTVLCESLEQFFLMSILWLMHYWVSKMYYVYKGPIYQENLKKTKFYQKKSILLIYRLHTKHLLLASILLCTLRSVML